MCGVCPADDDVNTYIKDLPLSQLSTDMGSENYNTFLSEPVRVTLRPYENQGSRKILSGDWLRVHLSPDVAGFYQADGSGAYTSYSQDFLSADKCELVGDMKLALRADLVDRPDNFVETQQEKPNSPANNPAVYSGVYMHSGEFVHEDVDLHLPGRGFDFVFQRTYRSQALYSGVLGWNWDHNYNKRLLEWTNGDVIYYAGSGRRERFVYGTQGYTAPKGWFTELKKQKDGTYRHIYPDRTIEFFDAYGRLAAIRDTNGNKMEFYYNLAGQLAAVMDTMGRMITFDYWPFELETNGEVKRNSLRLKTITDFSGRKVEFTYDTTTGDLIEVDKHTGDYNEEGVENKHRVKKYTYYSNSDIKLAHNLEKIIDPRGASMESPVLTVFYDTSDQVTSQDFVELAGNVGFTVGETSAAVNDARGKDRVFTIQDGHPKAIAAGGYTTNYDYTDEGLMAKITYPGGNKIIYTYDSGNGNRRSRANLLSVESESSTDGTLTTVYEYETNFNRVTKITDPKEKETTIVHDGRGNVKTVTIPGESASYTYSYDYYDDTLQLWKVTDPENSVTEYIYYPENAPSGDGSTPVTGRFDLNQQRGGYLQKITVDKDQDNISQEYLYDMLGNVKSHTDGEGVKTTYAYDNPFGDPTTIVLGATGTSDGQQPAVNHTIEREYDLNGNLDNDIQQSKGITIDYTFDRLNRLTHKKIIGANNLEQVFQYTYYDNSKLKEIINPRNKKVSFTYDDRDFLDIVTRGEGAETSTEDYTFNGDGQLHIYTDGETHSYTYNYDGHRRLKEIIDPLGNKVTYAYDANSNVEKVEGIGTDQAKLIHHYEYDPRNLVTLHKIQKENESSFITTAYGHNGAGYLNSVTPQNNHAWTITPTGSGLTKTVETPQVALSANAKVAYTKQFDKRGWVKQVTEQEGNEGTGDQLTGDFKSSVLGDPLYRGDNANRNYNYDYDVQKQLPRWVMDPLGRGAIQYEYDGLNRLWKEIRHIYHGSEKKTTSTKEYVYDENNNLRFIKDNGEDRTTEYRYDSKDRLTDIIYPGAAGSLHYTYNFNDQINTYTDLNGTTVTNTYDNANRLTNRNISKGIGVEGPTQETFEYDGLGRLRFANNDESRVEFVYYPDGRLQKEIVRIDRQAGDTFLFSYEVQYAYDDVNSKVTVTYPSGKILTITADELYRVSSIEAWENDQSRPVTSYIYQGMNKVSQKTLLNAVTMSAPTFDIGNRPTKITYTGADNKTFFDKDLEWNRLDLKNHALQGGKGENYTYDSASRLLEVNDTALNMKYKSEIDEAENLDKMTALFPDPEDPNVEWEAKSATFTQDYRHQLQGEDFDHDDNGNMKRFDNYQYFYDWKNQLVRVITGTGVTVEYKHDALGRRIEKIVTDPNGSDVKRYVHSGHQVIEEYEGDQLPETLVARYTYGNGIDEVVEIERDNNSDGTLESYIPMQETNGSVIGIADSTGNLLEKINYTPYGEISFIYDHNAPQVTQVILKDGVVYMRFSEPIDSTSVGTGTFTFEQEAGGEDIPGSWIGDIETGSIYFEPSEPLIQSTSLKLTVSTDVKDKHENAMENEFSQTFTHTGTDQVVYDSTPPEVKDVKVSSEEFVVTFTEEVNPLSIPGSTFLTTSSQTIHGTVTAVDDQTLKFVPDGSLSAQQEYSLNVSNSITDLSGKSLQDNFQHSFYHTGGEARLLYSRAMPWQNANSFTGNTVLFQGRNYEPETGLYYFRARYYHPGLGRFLQTDPMGYKDSMNMYQAFNANPVNFTDPMGLYHSYAERQLWTQSVLTITHGKKYADECSTVARDARLMAALNEGFVNYGIFGLINAAKEYTLFLPNLIVGHDILPWGVHVNITDKNRPFLDSVKRTNKEGDPRDRVDMLKDATGVIPIGESLGQTIADFYHGFIYRGGNSPVGEEARDNAMRFTGGVWFYSFLGKWATSEAPINSTKSRTNLPVKYDPEFAAKQLFGRDLKKGSLSEAGVRALYDPKVKLIDNKLAPTRTNAEMVHALRNAYKRLARDLMADREVAASLDKNFPLQNFEYFIKKYSDQGYSGEALWRRIMEGGKTPNKAVSKKYGIN
jgi:RHS repeat-associated protein